ncbi:MAG: tetratricopeptide repeat protein [Lachnoanaerobaculum sp.]|uniref:tetratricopeptide repeat protein n=1 Tax=unclassified Lachnoanaerobaculum TaxID=2625085 RepID=UPI00027A647E|nr:MULTISPECIES: tetratricopeptide repeat protein [unclassified Lachnoanaerobaculum]EJP18610.1 tetratricopeptide repeat protein [Lachnoanaerobaculum sp. ICM7]MBS5881914.1 tetratricopeptide repeat protein [Lachnoanaerobaculum sp.]
MKKNRRLEQISNGYYNLGLSLAKERNLSSALNALSISLGLNKKNTDARNLYGLIQFEMGEETKALISWVISININPINNPAQNYLQKLRNKSAYLEKSQDAISKYNKAISQIKTVNYDMARITLKQAVDIRPHFVKAMLALALLDIREGKSSEAKKLLDNVLSIDRFNTKAITYLEEMKPLTEKKARKEKLSVIGSPVKKEKTVENANNGMPVTEIYKNYSGMFTAINVGIGLIVGACAMVFLYMPTMKVALNNAHNKEIVEISQQLNDVNLSIETLKSENEGLNEQVNKLTEVNNTSTENMNYKLLQYVYFLGLIKEYNTKNYTRAAEIFSNLDVGQLTDVDNGLGISVTGTFAEMAPKMREEGPKLLLKVADGLNRSGDFAGAIGYYDAALRISPDYVEAKYKKALAYKTMGDVDTANNLFTEIITNYPDDRFANESKKERGY